MGQVPPPLPRDNSLRHGILVHSLVTNQHFIMSECNSGKDRQRGVNEASWVKGETARCLKPPSGLLQSTEPPQFDQIELVLLLGKCNRNILA